MHRLCIVCCTCTVTNQLSLQLTVLTCLDSFPGLCRLGELLLWRQSRGVHLDWVEHGARVAENKTGGGWVRGLWSGAWWFTWTRGRPAWRRAARGSPRWTWGSLSLSGGGQRAASPCQLQSRQLSYWWSLLRSICYYDIHITCLLGGK